MNFLTIYIFAHVHNTVKINFLHLLQAFLFSLTLYNIA